MNKLLRNIIAFSLKNRYFIFFCTAILLITGIITFRNMPIEAFPDVTNTEISIITQWPGRSAEEIEKFVTIPIEIAMNPVQQKISLRSTSIFGLSYVKLIFDDGVVDKDARAQVKNVPFAIVGGVAALHLTGTNFSISAGIGFIALFGICIQDGVLLITVFKHNLEHMHNESHTLYTAIKLGVSSRIRPVMMTALMAAIGLCPAAISHGIGSESSRPLARVVIGGILCAMIFSLLVFPLIFAWAYRNVDTKHQGPVDQH